MTPSRRKPILYNAARTGTDRFRLQVYVLIRRSQGEKDDVSAYEFGHKSNVACIRSTYGGVPEEWLTGNAPNYSWLASKAPLAWAKLEANGWKFLEVTKNAD